MFYLFLKVTTEYTPPMDDEDVFGDDSNLDNEFEAWIDEVANDCNDYHPFPSKIYSFFWFMVHTLL